MKVESKGFYEPVVVQDFPHTRQEAFPERAPASGGSVKDAEPLRELVTGILVAGGSSYDA